MGKTESDSRGGSDTGVNTLTLPIIEVTLQEKIVKKLVLNTARIDHLFVIRRGRCTGGRVIGG